MKVQEKVGSDLPESPRLEFSVSFQLAGVGLSIKSTQMQI